MIGHGTSGAAIYLATHCFIEIETQRTFAVHIQGGSIRAAGMQVLKLAFTLAYHVGGQSGTGEFGMQ